MTTSATAPEKASLFSPSPNRLGAAVDVLIYLALAAGFFGIEEAFRAAGRFPYPGLPDGAPTLVASFLLIVGLMKWRGQSWRDLGLWRPRRWWTIPVYGLVVIVVVIVSQLTLVPLLATIFTTPPPDLSRYDIIRGNLPMLIVSALGTMFTGGFIEEVIYRGFMVDRLGRVLGSDRRALIWAALLSGVPFGLIHFEWGIGGMLGTAVMGSVMGAMYLLTRRNLWPLIAAHASLDAILMIQAYTGAF
jgi:membrane protease YdiL (CAAX protease family)